MTIQIKTSCTDKSLRIIFFRFCSFGIVHCDRSQGQFYLTIGKFLSSAVNTENNIGIWVVLAKESHTFTFLGFLGIKSLVVDCAIICVGLQFLPVAPVLTLVYVEQINVISYQCGISC